MLRIRLVRIVALCLTLVALALSSSVAGAVVVQITSSINANTSWGLPGSGSTVEADVFWVRNTISVAGAVTLTMRPGIAVKFDPYTYLQVSGGLQAIGSGASTIYITSIKDDTQGGDTNGDGGSTLPNASDWGGITFSSMAPDSSRLAFCDIGFGGYSQRGVLQFATGISGRVTNCTLRRSYTGVECQGTASPLLVDTSIQASTVTPIILDFTSNPIMSSLVFSGGNNGYDALGLKGGTLSSAATLDQRGATVGASPITNLTYVLLSGLTIAGSGSLTIAPGVVVKPVAGVGFSVSGNLTMNGTPTDTITVTSINDDNFGQPRDTNNNGSITAPNRGDWSNITFAQGATGSMQYCRLKFGTNNTYSGLVETTNQSFAISNTLLSDAAHGLTMHGTASPPLTDVEIDNMSSTPTLMSVSANPTFTNVSFVANAITALGIIGENVATNSHLTQRTVAGYANITYYLMNGTLDIQNPATLTIDAGVVIKMQLTAASTIVIEGTLTANGTVGSPIVFTSERDDLWGNPGDTNGDGSSTVPTQGNWSYVRFTSTASGSSVMNYCRLQYASASPYDGYPTSLWITSSSPTISNCNINKGYYGMRIDGSAAPVIGPADTVINCGNAPVVMSVQSNPTFTQPYFKSNAVNGIALIAETLSQNSSLRYRPEVAFVPPDPATPYAYVTTGTITVPSGVTLAIEPRVVIKVNSGTPFSVSGAINAVGSGGGSNRVIFTSIRDDANGGDTNADGSATSPTTGNWGTAVQFNSTAPSGTNILRNVLVTFGGNGGPTSAALTTFSASPRIAAVEFLFNVSAMTFNGNSKPTVDSVSVLNCTSIPIAFSLTGDPSFAHITWSGNTYTVLGILGETISQDVRLTNRSLGAGILNNITYAPTGDITVGFGATWTINPGIVFKLGRVYYDPVGTSINIDGALVANGKPDSLIVFTSMGDDAFGGDNNGDGASSQPAVGQWGGINFRSTTNTVTTLVNNVRIRYGGFFSTRGMSFTNTGPTVTNTDFTACYEGVYIAGNSAPTFTNVNIDSSSWMPVRMSLVSNPVFNNVQFRKNYLTGLGVINETIAQDLLWKIRPVSGRQNMPYLIDGTLGIGLGSTVTLQPGLIVKFRYGQIQVNRAFVAEGRTSPDSLIVFSSTRDDFYGGRTDSLASTTPPAPGDWYYVSVLNTAITGQVRFKNCVFRYGGSGSTQGVLRAVSSSPAVDSCLFAYNTVGVSVEGSANPVIHGSSLYGNTYYAVSNTGTSFCTDATGCWWGAASGPNDANAAADVCGAGQTNAGTGDAVTNNVDYTGFTTSGIQNPLLGDVTLNGVVTALDASYILQYLATTLSLSPLQTLVADVDMSPGITSLDASLILQLVTGNVLALPRNRTGAQPAPRDELVSREELAALELVRRAHGTFDVVLGEPRREGSQWALPVRITGTAPIYGAELQLEGGHAAEIAGVTVAGGALNAVGTPNGTARVVFAAGQEIPAGDVATLYFPAGDGGAWTPPALTWARVNADLVVLSPASVETPVVSFLAHPTPNPARRTASLVLGVGAGDAGARARVVVLDLAGRLVRTVHDGPLVAGVHRFTWDLRDTRGRALPPGVYLVSGAAGRFSSVQRLIVVR